MNEADQKEAQGGVGQTLSAGLEELVRLRDQRRAEFAATVSHDLKTPLNAIVGFTGVLLLEAARVDPAWVRQLQLVRASARQLLDRINDLLEFYRMEGGKVAVSPTWCAPRELILQALEPFRETAVQKGVALGFDPSGVPLRLRTEPELLLRVFREFVSNALKFTRGGSVHFGGSTVASEPAGGIEVRFSVQDTGTGLQPESLSALSLSMGSARTLAGCSYSGLGLGLAICREAAILLGGRIEIESVPDRGCKFTLVLDIPKEDFGE